MSAAAMPPRAYGKTTPRIISQRVVPSPSAASFNSDGTPRKSSRLMLETIGRIMIASTMIAVKMLAPAADGGPKSGIQPKTEWSQRSMCRTQRGAEHEDAPQPDEHARDGGQCLDERRHRGLNDARCELGEEQRDSERERCRDQEREERRDDSAEEEAAGAVQLVSDDRVPRDRA